MTNSSSSSLQRIKKKTFSLSSSSSSVPTSKAITTYHPTVKSNSFPIHTHTTAATTTTSTTLTRNSRNNNIYRRIRTDTIQNVLRPSSLPDMDTLLPPLLKVQFLQDLYQDWNEADVFLAICSDAEVLRAYIVEWKDQLKRPFSIPSSTENVHTPHSTMTHSYPVTLQDQKRTLEITTDPRPSKVRKSLSTTILPSHPPPPPLDEDATDISTPRTIQHYTPSSYLTQSILSGKDSVSVTYPIQAPCNCVKSKCLKLYCDCFQAGQICTLGYCECIDCENSLEQSTMGGLRFRAIEALLARKPDAFDFTAKRMTGEGCMCKKNRCLKKYCECFSRNLICTSTCQCHDCMNQSENAPFSKFLERQKVQPRQTDRKKQNSLRPCDPIQRNHATQCDLDTFHGRKKVSSHTMEDSRFEDNLDTDIYDDLLEMEHAHEEILSIGSTGDLLSHGYVGLADIDYL